jgi:cell division protein FtsB
MIDFDDIFEKKRFDNRIFFIIAAVIVIAAYIFNLMFGNKSISQLIDLQNSIEVLEKRVENLKKENAKLQKEYFELKELEGES